ncbi:MAG: ferritin-like domain-containing protein [Chitinophagaceae bacterium]
MQRQKMPVKAIERADGAITRGIFLREMAGIASVTAAMAGCGKEGDGVNLGSGDVGILNYAYALEQLQAAFYAAAVDSLYNGITASEQALLTDIRDHEIVHREFLKTALDANAIPALKIDFSKVSFSSRESVLTTARTLEDLGVAAYNAAGKLIKGVDNLLLAGKIVSVEARHAGYIRDLISNGSFADNTAVDLKGLDLVKTPKEVLASASAYLKSKLNTNYLPAS